ncbi:MAG: universal stress protein [Actinobacteria bacterium]|nr:universal stress protein [Actinomycetota bacterium]
MAGRSGDRQGLERDLGLLPVVTISLGAMIGSGIFVLPGFAAGATGPAAPLAYLLAGLIVLPAALSKAELSTAMPQSGGTYLFIDRAMGPLVGTVAGFGVWFSLVFKAAFALVGLGAYLQILLELPARPVAIVAAGALIALNIAGTKQSGQLQTVVVSAVLLVLAFFVVDGLRAVELAAFRPLLPAGTRGLLAASGLVFVSYAGVTKITSVAEEIRDPGRIIPLGILSSIGLMAMLYTVLVGVVVGVVPLEELADTLTPIALAAQQVLGPVGEQVIAATAVLALVSMANAGLLTSSRYPFAMSRDALLPSWLERIHGRFATPAAAIGVTGAFLVVLVGLVPVIDLAKLASAFQILVFSLVNVALIVFRHADMAWYRPTFRSPGYPWVQAGGVVGGLVLLTQMGTVSIVGAVLIVAAGVTLYRSYGRARTVREGVALDVLRRRSDRRFVRVTERALAARTHRVVIPAFGDVDRREEAALVWLAVEVAASRHGEVHLLRMPAAADPTARAGNGDPDSGGDRRSDLHRGVSVTEHRVTGQDLAREVVEHVAAHEADLLVVAVGQHGDGRLRFFTDDVQSMLDTVACDTVFVRAGEGLQRVDDIVVIGAGGPFDELKVVLANRIAIGARASIRLVHIVDLSASDTIVTAVERYHARLGNLTAVPTTSVVERSEDRVDRLCQVARDSDIVVIGATERQQHVDADFTDLVDHIAAVTTTPLLIAHAHASHRHSYLGRFLERMLYGPRVGGRGLR